MKTVGAILGGLFIAMVVVVGLALTFDPAKAEARKATAAHETAKQNAYELAKVRGAIARFKAQPKRSRTCDSAQLLAAEFLGNAQALDLWRSEVLASSCGHARGGSR